MTARHFRTSSTAGASTPPIATPTSIPRTSATSSASSRARRAADLDEAIAAARRAFATWSQSTPQQRFDILDRAGTEILARKDELGRLLSREQGKPLADGIGEAARAGAIFKFFAGEALRAGGEKIASVRPGIDVEVTREPLGVVGLDHAVELPARDSRVEDRAGARVRQHASCSSRPSSCPASPWTLADIVQRAGLPAGVLNLVIGPGSTLGARARRVAGHRRGELHRIAGRRPVGRGRGGEGRRARAARNGRQEPARRARRRRSADGGVGRGQRRVLPGGPALHRVEPAHRDRRHSRSIRRRDDRSHEDAGH